MPKKAAELGRRPTVAARSTTRRAGANPTKLRTARATSYRVRAFLSAVNGNVRAFVQTARTSGKIPDGVPMLAAWDPYLPTSFGGNANAGELAEGTQNCTGANGGPPCAEGPAQAGVYTSVRNHLGGNIFRSNAQSATGCFTNSPGTHSFRFPAGMYDGSIAPVTPEHPVDVYDTKTLNCVPYVMAQAFCVWDGGRLETFSEWQAAWGGGTLPWSAMDARNSTGWSISMS